MLEKSPDILSYITSGRLQFEFDLSPILQVCQDCTLLLRRAEAASHDCTLQQQQLDALRRAVNPYSAEADRLSQLRADSQSALNMLQLQRTDLQQQVDICRTTIILS